jgi:hypothetical protein
MNYPKIDDEIYKEIESFEDYEYTNCIAYEMATRTNSFFNDVLQGIEYFNNLYLVNKVDIENKSQYITYNNEDFALTKEQSYILYLTRYTMRIFSVLYEIGICRNSINDIFKIKEIENFELIKELKKYKELKKINNTFYGDEVYCDYKEGFSISQLQGDIDSPLNNIINADWKRPRLHYINGRHAEIELNLNLPVEELKAYIEQIKKEYDKNNTTILSPLELLGENIEKAQEITSKAIPKGKEKRKKAMANAFYVYDIYKIIEQEYSTKTYNLKAERDAKINSIRQNKNYDRQERNSIIQDIKEEYTFLIEQYSKTSIKTEINLQSGLSIDDIERYKALMNKYIDELKYKELITGISN